MCSSIWQLDLSVSFILEINGAVSSIQYVKNIFNQSNCNNLDADVEESNGKECN